MMRSMASALAAAVVLVVGTGGCAPAATAGGGTPIADPDSLQAAVRAATTPAAPRQTTFTWRLDEAGSVVQGRGVVRYQAPDRIRLDLFGPRGETYLIAALVGEELRLPPTATGGFELPSPALLWGALGVVRPPADATLEGAASHPSGATLRYSSPDGTRHDFSVSGDPDPRLERVERIGGSGVLETVRVEYSADGEPSRTTYVDRRTYRELVLETESSRDVESFPESIWRPDGPSGQS